MNRSELEAWGLVGAGAVIITLLLLDYSPMTAAPAGTITVSPVQTPNPQGTVTVPADNVGGTPLPPWQTNYPGVTNPTIDLTILSGPQCGCGCSGQQVVQEQDLSASINTLNQQLASNTLANEAAYFAGVPDDSLFATNATGIGAFTTAVGLPAPMLSQNVTAPASYSLGNCGSLGYSFQGANPWPVT